MVGSRGPFLGQRLDHDAGQYQNLINSS